MSTGQVPRCFATKPDFTSTPSRSRPRLSSGCRAPSASWPLPSFLLQPVNLRLLRLHHALARQRLLRGGRQLTHPLPQHVSCTIRLRAARATDTPLSLTSLTASSSNTRLSCRLVPLSHTGFSQQSNQSEMSMIELDPDRMTFATAAEAACHGLWALQPGVRAAFDAKRRVAMGLKGQSSSTFSIPWRLTCEGPSAGVH